jgi:dTDP-4-amino-4,6-dideoxygalactose transaminase
MKLNKPIYVTRPSLPPLEEFTRTISKLWETRVLTNGGEFHRELEKRLCEYLNVPFVSLFTNATIALVAAFKSLNLTGEVITTPYSFVATSHSLLWNNLTPVFVDIDPKTFNISVEKIESAITENTSAILAVHCYGIPCDVEQIERVALKHNLRVIYDAAHAFGVTCDCASLLNHGNLSILSFHATKVFHTFEGGAIVCADSQTKRKIDNLKNFGFLDEVTIENIGINGKMSELHAAMGILQLKNIDVNLLKRRRIAEQYEDQLAPYKHALEIKIPLSNRGNNFGYYPILVKDEARVSRDELYLRLMDDNIYTRRYFYPLISNIPVYSGLKSASPSNLQIANDVARRVLCLPIYPELSSTEVSAICQFIIEKIG